MDPTHYTESVAKIRTCTNEVKTLASIISGPQIIIPELIAAPANVAVLLMKFVKFDVIEASTAIEQVPGSRENICLETIVHSSVYNTSGFMSSSITSDGGPV